MSATLIETAEEDSYVVVVQHVADLLNNGQVKTALAETSGSRFLTDCEGLVRQARFDEVIGQLISHLDLILSKSSEKDAAACLSVMVHLLSRVVADDRYVPTTSKLATALATKPEVMGEVKLGALQTLYAVAATNPARYVVLLAMLQFATDSRPLAALLAPAVRGKAEAWVRGWELGQRPGQAVKLYMALAGLMKVVGDRASIKEYLRAVTAAMALVEPKDPDMTKTWVPIAAEAVKAFIRSPDLFQCDFWELAPVQALSKEPKTAPLLKLLDALLAGDLAAFKAGATPAVLKEVDIPLEAALDKTRLMALLALGSRPGGVVTFADIQQALDITPEEVQPWIVRAIGGKLLDGKIDQVAETLTVLKCHHRTFTQQEWSGLAQQLAALSASLSNVAGMVGAKRGGGSSSSSSAAVAAGGRQAAGVVH